MAKPFLSLNIPKPGLAGWPVVASSDPQLLREFKRIVIEQWEEKVSAAASSLEAEICRLELSKLRSMLDLLILEDQSPGPHA